MSNISVVSFVYNEEANIVNWLFNLKNYVKEIVIFDLESTDNTFDLCKQYTDRVYKRPYLICGDSYKQELSYMSKGDWLLWTYPDERFSDSSLQVFDKITAADRWNAYSFMRHEYMDGVRVCFQENTPAKRILAFGTPDSPNYQCRLHKKDDRIYYTEFVHAEIHGQYSICNMPPEYYIEHFKTSQGQEFDNIRLYVWYKFLIWKYGNTQVPEYKKYVDSYRTIVRDSEKANLSGARQISLAEEFWWDWRKYASFKRLSLDEFKNLFNINYEEFLQRKHTEESDKFTIDNTVIDSVLKNMATLKE